MKMRIITKKKIHLTGLWTYNGAYSADAWGHIYAYKEWCHRKWHFDIQLYIPYLKESFYDCERATNRRLNSVEVQLRAEMEQLRDKVERRYNRYIKLHKSRA